MLKGLTQEDNPCLYALSGHMDIIKEDPSVSQTESCPCITRTAIHLYSGHVILQHFPCNSCSRGNAWLAVAFSRGLHTGRGCFWWGNLWRGIPISLLPHLRPARSMHDSPHSFLWESRIQLSEWRVDSPLIWMGVISFYKYFHFPIKPRKQTVLLVIMSINIALLATTCNQQ